VIESGEGERGRMERGMKSTNKKLTLQGSALPPTAPGLSLAKSEVTHFFEHSLGET